MLEMQTAEPATARSGEPASDMEHAVRPLVRDRGARSEPRQ
jgi:hypothetical protein